jgi:aminoglycoside phosphotransferase family enzyme/predicted kinase
MVIDEQRDVVAFLSAPGTFGGSLQSAERIDTHISIVWLAGEHAYKLKRAVKFDYVDFSTPGARRQACEAEVRLNRRTAPSLYLGVVPITRTPVGALVLAGDGEPVDWLVEMARFDQDTLFDRLAERHQLDSGLMEPLADAIVRLHGAAEPRLDLGGRAGMAWVIDGNEAGLSDEAETPLDRRACHQLTDASRAALDRQTPLLEARRARGFVRSCHGDLHLRNICLVGGTPTLFDAVEFNERISCVDVIYDVAFLLMDLWHRQLRMHASVVFNQYFAQTLDLDGLALLPLFLSCRATVRAKTVASAAKVQPDDQQRGELEAVAREYLTLAQNLLRPVSPCLIAVGGFSGAGKTTLARGLSPEIGAAPGALILRSDVIRKAISGVPTLTRLGPEGYTQAITEQVYRAMAERARVALLAGHTVVVDAVYARESERQAVEAIAREVGVPFVGFWLEGPSATLEQRISDRSADASDATVEVLQRQRTFDLGRLDWHRLDASPDAASVQRAALQLIPPALHVPVKPVDEPTVDR